MLSIVAPIFIVIFIGYLFGRFRTIENGSDKLLNDYVLYVALPALLFTAVAEADPRELLQWEFAVATLSGICVAYLLGLTLAYFKNVKSPNSSIIGMAACYGTTGYMGIPIAISAFGEPAAVPAAMATILHNIPAIMAVIITYDVYSNAPNKKNSIALNIFSAFKTTLLNPLTVSVIAGIVFSILSLNIPDVLSSFTKFLAAAAGPTALFALGLGLAKLDINQHFTLKSTINLSPIVLIKVIVQPLATFLTGHYILGMSMNNIWFVVAVLMAAQPIGAGVYVFASKYGFFKNETAISIILSLLITIFTISLLLEY
jgi:predicted permease